MDKQKYTKGMMYSDSEISLIKNTFSDMDTLLAVRKALLGADLIEVDLAKLARLSADAVSVLKRAFNPKVNLDLPLGQALDLLMTLELKDKSVAECIRAVNVRLKLLELIERGLDRLSTGQAQGANDIAVFNGGIVDEIYITNLFARNSLIVHVDGVLSTLSILAAQADETKEESKKRAKKDSAK